jgi:alpha-glucosidase
MAMFYGGDKATQKWTGKRLENFATDQYAFQKDQEPLYKWYRFILTAKQTSIWSFRYL